MDATDKGAAGMPALDEWIEANANLTLWCVHSLGPDEVDAAPSHAEAVKRADAVNRAVHSAIIDQKRQANNILCFAYAAPWIWSQKDHVESLKNWEADIGQESDAP